MACANNFLSSFKVRAVTELCDIDGESEITPLPNTPPVALYRPDGTAVLVHLFYSNNPPPPGPLESADEEDPSDHYDWYTFDRAMAAVTEESSRAALRTAAWALAGAATFGVVENKWGGVFGQEFTGFGAEAMAAGQGSKEDE